eukprot:8231913-Pyramimonas_sp.AAC.1
MTRRGREARGHQGSCSPASRPPEHGQPHLGGQWPPRRPLRQLGKSGGSGQGRPPHLGECPWAPGCDVALPRAHRLECAV